MKKKITRTNIRAFSRNVYAHLDKVPLAVYNTRTGKLLFVLISDKKAGEIYDLSPKDFDKPDK